MYAPFFGLSREPFSLAPDPRFLFMSERHREALAHLLYGVGGGGGFVLLTGEIGAGKTTVARCFLEQLPPHCVVAYIFNPCLSVIELLQTVCGEFGMDPQAPGASVKAHVDALNSFLLDAHAKGRHVLLVIDEAQALDAPVLEQLRLLTNLETSERKLLQIVLIGQPELRTMLAQPGLEQLAQRVIARYHLGPLSAIETRQYVQHRMGVAGPNVPVPFDSAALARLHRLAEGVPRRINLLADRALLGAYGLRRRDVDARMVEQAAAEVFDHRPRSGQPPASLLAALVLGAITLLALLLWVWPRQEPQPLPVAAAPASAAAPRPASTPVVPGAPGTEPRRLSSAGEVLAAAHGSEALAWRELALRWGVAIGEGEPCVVAAQAQLACFRSAAGGLQLSRQLARPALLVLHGEGRARGYVLLVALNETRATLQVGRQQFELGLPALVSVWRGELATFWRTPPGWRAGQEGDLPAAGRGWVEQQLGDQAAGAPPRPWRERIAAYQAVQGLPPDGRAGPLTLMSINRTAGVDEPRLPQEAGR